MTMPLTKLKPTEKQLSFMDWELGLFVHFGIRTFYEGHKDWDGQVMEPNAFAPTALDCSQWLETASRAGCHYAVLTAKHHDGFAVWPTRFSDYSVAASPWKDGKGDVVREFTDACGKFGIKPGLYYSPADASVDRKGWTASESDDYFIAQVGELLTGYGPIDILWFDGCGSEGHEYDWARIIGEIRRMQPGIRIFNMGDPDIRWIGNEAGVADLCNWNEVDAVPFSILSEKKETLGPDGAVWLPGECDCRMRSDNWFYSDSDEHTVKSVDELLGLYYLSVGRGTNLLINIGPDRRGLLPDKDAAALIGLGDEVKRRFSNPIAGIGDFAAATDSATFAYVYKADNPVLIDHAVLCENIREGQRVQRFTLSAKPYPYGDPIVLYEGRTIGHKAICRFPAIRTSEVTVEITECEGGCALDDVQLFYCGR
jgi:alpha-L-fucosidase